MVDFDQITETLPRLSKKQLEQIKGRINLLLAHQPKTVVPLEEEDWILRGILIALKDRGLCDEAFVRNFRLKPASFPRYHKHVDEVKRLLEQCAPGISLVERRALGEVAGRELAKYIWQDVSLTNLLNNVEYIPHAIDKSFPGYMASKMLAVLVGYV